MAMMATAGCSADEPPKDLPDASSTEKPEEPVAPVSDQKIPVVDSSYTGNTETIAGYIHGMVKSDLVALETEDT